MSSLWREAPRPSSPQSLAIQSRRRARGAPSPPASCARDALRRQRGRSLHPAPWAAAFPFCSRRSRAKFKSKSKAKVKIGLSAQGRGIQGLAWVHPGPIRASLLCGHRKHQKITPCPTSTCTQRINLVQQITAELSNFTLTDKEAEALWILASLFVWAWTERNHLKPCNYVQNHFTAIKAFFALCVTILRHQHLWFLI